MMKDKALINSQSHTFDFTHPALGHFVKGLRSSFMKSDMPFLMVAVILFSDQIPVKNGKL